jgi:plasmid stabilization system protein ParE
MTGGALKSADTKTPNEANSFVLVNATCDSAKDNPLAARRIGQALRGSIRHLVDHPQMGEALDAPAGVRRWVAAWPVSPW